MYFLLLLFWNVSGGTIKANSITNTIANKDQRSDYTFILTPSSNVPAGGSLEIIFPIQYKAGLGGQAYCTNCQINLNSVIFYFSDVILSVATTFHIYNVLNPSLRGGTANFIVRTRRNEYVYDENLIFSTIGIADDITLLSSSLVSTATSPTAGALTKYNFAFKTNTNLPKGTTVQLFIPSVFTISQNPSCSLYPINGVSIEGNIYCSKLEGSKILVQGFGAEILSGSEIGIQVSMTNPQYSQITEKFTIAAYREGTSVIYTWRTQINSVQILPGLIKEVALKPLQSVRQATGKVMDYQLTFLPTNPLPDKSIIKIIFPSTFQVVTGALQYVFLKQGLDDVSEASPLKITVTSSDITFSSFNATQPTTMIVYFRALNPSTSGPTQALTIRTYTDSSLQYIIDENKADAYTTIELIPSLSPRQVGTTPTSAESQSQSINIQFTIYPSVVIPPNAFIKVLFNDAFTVGTVSNTNCLANTSPITYSLFCNKSDNLIMWQNPSTIQYNTNLASYFGINSLISSPIYARTDYLIDIDLFAANGTIIQSYSDYISIVPKNIITGSSVDMLGKEYTTATTIKTAIFTASFMNEIIIPEGGYDPTNVKSYSRIEVWFGVNPTDYDSKLGTTLSDGSIIPCKAINGLIPIDNLKIICNLYHATATEPPKVVMRNYKEIPLETYITIHIPGVRSPLNTATPVPATYNVGCSIKLVQYDNRWKTILNQLDPTITFVQQGGAVPGVGNTDMSINNFKLSGIFNLSFKMFLGNDLIPNSHLLVKVPGYDTMFVPYEDTIVCYIDTYLTPCIAYPGIDWILLSIQSTQTHYYALQPVIYIYNFNWPRYVDSVGYVDWIIIQSNKELEIKTLKYTSSNLFFPPPQVNDFDVAQILSPKKGKGYVGLEFQFLFQSSYLIPDYGSFILTFPSDFQLDGSYPQAQFSAPQFYGVTTTAPLTFSAVGNVLTITNIKEFPASGPFTVIVKGVRSRKSPSSGTAKPFIAEIQLKGKSIVKTADLINGFDQFQYADRFSAGSVIFVSISAFPNNQLEYAKYEFKFVLTNELMEGGIIKIKFPYQFYSSLPIPGIDTRCYISGGLASFKSCDLVGYEYIIITDSRYQSGEITFTISNVLNPKQGLTVPFTISSEYDGELLDVSDDKLLSPRSLTITAKANAVLVQSIDFYPKNEGEQATYIFSFVPSSTIDSVMAIITFPQNYDSILGNSIQCKPYDCSVDDRQVTLTGITKYTPLGTSPLVVYVEGVINPNKNENDLFTGQFKIGTILQNSYSYIDYNSKAGTVSISTAPGWAYLYTVIPQNQYSRWQNTTYSFNMTSLLPVPKVSSEGSIIVDFPSQFDIPDGSKQCVPFQSDFAVNLTCTSKSNSVTVQGNTVDKNGVISFNISDIANPPDEITIDNILIKTYDGFKKEIVEKSYVNLDPWTFSYTFPGPLITFNNDEVITVERGTQTVDLWVRVSYPCALNLEFSGVSDGLEIVPSKIKLSLTDLEQKFRISAPESLSPATYSIQWVVSGEQDPPYYTPVKKSIVKVTNNKNIRIDVPSLNEIPVGGNSLDTLISVDYAPNLGFEILLTSDSTPLILNTRSVQFIAGQNNASFRVSCNETEYYRLQNLNQLGQLSISLTLSGINQDVYILSQSQLYATIISKDTEQPFITGLITDQTKQTQTNLVLSAGEISVIYYMIALQGTQSPTSKELIDLGPAQYNTTQSQYGKVSIGKSNTDTVVIRSLKAQTPYIIYALAEDRGGQYSDIKNYQFQTLDRYNASSTTLTFKQSYLNSAERTNILGKVAFVLSLPTDKVIEKTSSTTGRLLQTEIGLSIYIISIPTLQNFPSPYEMVDELNSKMTTLSKLVTNLDTANSLVATEFTPAYPQFITPPSVVNYTFTTCTVQGKLDQKGFLFIISILASQDTSSPLAQQIWWGFNSYNIPVPSKYVQVEIANTAYNLTIENLSEDTDYNIYMIAGSAHPGYPDISTNESDIHLIPCRTEARNGTIHLDINQASKVLISLFLLIILN